MPITVENLVSREVHYCVSILIAQLVATADGCNDRDLSNLGEQALELCAPIDDWEEAARQEGWHPQPLREEMYWDHTFDGRANIRRDECPTWQDLCERLDIEPYQREVYEHWIVSDWLADKLAERGEKVDKDFAGLIVWARTTTGQGIASDSVIEAIHADLVGEA